MIETKSDLRTSASNCQMRVSVETPRASSTRTMSAAEVSRVFGAIVGASEMLEILDGEWVRVTIAIPSEKEEAA